MTDTEQNIVIESANFYGYMLPSGHIEIRLKQTTHAVAVGTVATWGQAKRFIERCERYPNNLKYLVQN